MTYENPFDIALTGEEIKDWIWHYSHIRSKKYTKLANHMTKFFNLDNDKVYMLRMCDGAPVAVEVKERGIAYDIPCDD